MKLDRPIPIPITERAIHINGDEVSIPARGITYTLRYHSYAAAEEACTAFKAYVSVRHVGYDRPEVLEMIRSIDER
jgi:hypothetical protein